MPEVGRRYRLRRAVYGRDDTGFPAGLVGEVLAIVPAAEDGAGDHVRACAVIQFENGRTWSHPIEDVVLTWDELFEAVPDGR